MRTGPFVMGTGHGERSIANEDEGSTTAGALLLGPMTVASLNPRVRVVVAVSHSWRGAMSPRLTHASDTGEEDCHDLCVNSATPSLSSQHCHCCGGWRGGCSLGSNCSGSFPCCCCCCRCTSSEPACSKAKSSCVNLAWRELWKNCWSCLPPP